MDVGESLMLVRQGSGSNVGSIAGLALQFGSVMSIVCTVAPRRLPRLMRSTQRPRPLWMVEV